MGAVLASSMHPMQKPLDGWSPDRIRGACSRLERDILVRNSLVAVSLTRRQFLHVFTDMDQADEGIVWMVPLSVFRMLDETNTGTVLAVAAFAWVCLFGSGQQSERYGILYNILGQMSRDASASQLAAQASRKAAVADPAKHQWPRSHSRIPDGVMVTAISALAPCLVASGLWRRPATAPQIQHIISNIQVHSTNDWTSPDTGAAGAARMGTTRHAFVTWLQSDAAIVQGAVPCLWEKEKSDALVSRVVLLEQASMMLARGPPDICPQFDLGEGKVVSARPLGGSQLASSSHRASAHVRSGAGDEIGDDAAARRDDQARRMKVERATCLAEVHRAADSSGFTIEDVHRIKKVFVEHASCEGFLGLRQFRAVMALVFPRLVMEGSVDVLFRDFDVDGDGVCDFKELVIGLAGLAHGSLEHQVDLLFDLFDSDGDGALTVFELLRFVKETSDRKFQAVNRAVEAVTAAGSERQGFLTLAELGTLAYENPEVLQALAQDVDAPLAARILGPDSSSAATNESDIRRRDKAERDLRRFVEALRELQAGFPDAVTFPHLYRSVTDMLDAENASKRVVQTSFELPVPGGHRRQSEEGDAAGADRPLSAIDSSWLRHDSITSEVDSDPSIPPPMAWALHSAASLNRLRFKKLLRWSFLGPPEPEIGKEASDIHTSALKKTRMPGLRPVLDLTQERDLLCRFDQIVSLAFNVVAAAPGILSPFDLIAKGLSTEPLEKVAAVFRRLDSNGTGLVQRVAVARAILTLQGASDRLLGVASKLIAHMDTDNDGSVSRQEFALACKTNPSIMSCMCLLLGADQNLADGTDPELIKRRKMGARRGFDSTIASLVQSPVNAVASVLSPARLAPGAVRDEDGTAFSSAVFAEEQLAAAVDVALAGNTMPAGVAKPRQRAIAGIRLLDQTRSMIRPGQRHRPQIVVRQPGMAAKIGSACSHGAKTAMLLRKGRRELELHKRKLDKWAERHR